MEADREITTDEPITITLADGTTATGMREGALMEADREITTDEPAPARGRYRLHTGSLNM